MKTLYTLALCLLLFTIQVRGQFLEKMKNSVRESTENTAIDQASNIASQKTAEAMDFAVDKAIEGIGSLFKKKNKKKRKKKNRNAGRDTGQEDFEAENDEMEDGDEMNMMDQAMNIQAVDPASLPGSYEFSWVYVMRMQNDEGKFDMEYFLEPGADYFAAKPNMEQEQNAAFMLMVMDAGRNINTIFMDMSGQKFATPSSIPVSKFEGEPGDGGTDFTFDEIGTKKILGYTCQGVKVENPETKMVLYFTTDAPVSFTNLFSAQKNNLFEAYNPVWFSEINNTLLMEMVYTDKSDGSVTTIQCVSLKKKPVRINVSEYKFMNMMR